MSEDEEIPYFETSAATGSNVEEAFMAIAKAIRLKFDPKEGKMCYNMIKIQDTKQIPDSSEY